MRLRTELLVLFTLLTLTSSGVVFLEFHSHQRLIAKNAEREAERQADSTAVRLDDRLNASKRTLTVAAAYLDASDHGTDAQTEYLNSLLERTAFDSASVVAENGPLVTRWPARRTSANRSTPQPATSSSCERPDS